MDRMNNKCFIECVLINDFKKAQNIFRNKVWLLLSNLKGLTLDPGFYNKLDIHFLLYEKF